MNSPFVVDRIGAWGAGSGGRITSIRGCGNGLLGEGTSNKLLLPLVWVCSGQQ